MVHSFTPRSAMRFEQIGESGAWLIHLNTVRDDRGSFARVWCSETFRSQKIAFAPVQGNTSRTLRRGSIRGMHFQRAPHADAKIVRCSQGAIYDVIVDLRPTSETRGRWFAQELSGDDDLMVYIPKGFAHGFQTLTDAAVVEYLMGEKYVPELYDGFRHDDPAVAIRWPLPASAISERDMCWPDLSLRLPWWPGEQT
ncbi:dTDP-4-dehydrorhamnose 3,5-epimerase family protein [Bradyrhizobium sp. sBnM-33]|uniref:dTDP-4-dehydrorhamnose 3,5-epimerase family protein n=1 Tax=Bradyrhizobium sp. sBnM-33 TaxID=2831780 RepID=UPI0028984332|nr:dTDP-4-dehydrorhamnose 3,5-epimerase family protein [Bradyrhizobium sp. sBnM-33]